MVAVHPDFCGYEHGASGVISVALSQIAQNPILILSRFGTDLEAVAKDVKEWKVGSNMQYVFRSLPYEPALAALSTRMLRSRATPKAGLSFASASGDIDETSLLERMAVMVHVERVSDDGSFTHWRLTTSGMQDLRACRKVHSPQNAMVDMGACDHGQVPV